MPTVTRDPLSHGSALASASPQPVSGLSRRTLAVPAVVASVVAAVVAGASIAGLVQGAELYGVVAPSVLVSPGGDAANLGIVLPVLLSAMWLARRGSLASLLLWPGALFYVLYIELIYLVVGPFTALSLAYAAAAVGSAAAIIGLLNSINSAEVRDHLADVPARALGAALVVIALVAYAGLVANAVTSFGQLPVDEGFRGQWVIDMVVGTPALLAGGLLLWRRHSFGYLTTPGLLLVSALGGLAFAAAALFERLVNRAPPELAVVGVHLAISAISVALLVVTLRPGPRSVLRPRSTKEVAP